MRLTFAETLAAQGTMAQELRGVKTDRQAAMVLNRKFRKVHEKKVMLEYGINEPTKRAFTWAVTKGIIMQVCADYASADLKDEIWKAGLQREMKWPMDRLADAKNRYYKGLERVMPGGVGLMLDQADWMAKNIVRPDTIALKKAIYGLAVYQKVERPDLMTAACLADMMAETARQAMQAVLRKYVAGWPPPLQRYFANLRFDGMANILSTMRDELEKRYGVVNYTNARKLMEALEKWSVDILDLEEPKTEQWEQTIKR